MGQSIRAALAVLFISISLMTRTSIMGIEVPPAILFYYEEKVSDELQ